MMTRTYTHGHTCTQPESHTRVVLKSKQLTPPVTRRQIQIKNIFFVYSINAVYWAILWHYTHLRRIVELLYRRCILNNCVFQYLPTKQVALLHSATLKWILSVKREKAIAQFYYSKFPDLYIHSIYIFSFDIATAKMRMKWFYIIAQTYNMRH